MNEQASLLDDRDLVTRSLMRIRFAYEVARTGRRPVTSLIGGCITIPEIVPPGQLAFWELPGAES